MSTKKTAAFFDFDGTLYNGVVAFDFLKFLVANRLLKIREIVGLLKLFYYYALDKFSLAERYNTNKKIYQKVIGWNSHSLESNSRKFLESRIAHKLFHSIAKILDEHSKNGHKIIIVTTALREIVSPIRKLIKIDDIIATEVEIKNELYTGKIKLLPVGKNRIKIIRKYCNLHNIDIKKSYAYSDHFSDIPMLENIGNPVAVNPDRKLKIYALKKGWRVIN